MATHAHRQIPSLDLVAKDAAYHTRSNDEIVEYHETLRGYTKADRAAMYRMGKKQELRRNYRPLSALAFTVMIQATWEVLLAASTQGLVNGGPAGLIWSFTWTFFGFFPCILSLAEMSSMAPTAGGQYHWASEFSPPRFQKLISFFVGWMSTLSWQAGAAAGPFLTGTLIQASAAVVYPDYDPNNWRGTLLVIAVTLIICAFNIWGTEIMPFFNNIMLVAHVFGFLVITICFWVLSPRTTAEVTFTKFRNDGGWSTMGVSLMIGQISAVYACICSDCAAHLAEEVKDAGQTVPQAMIGAYVLNGILGIVFLISYMFMVTDVDAALKDPTTYPHIWVWRQALPSGGVVALNSILIIIVFAGSTPFSLSASRQTWAFARDRGLPFCNWISSVDKRVKVPVNAVLVTAIISSGLALINIGSSVAIDAILSLNIVALMFTYVFSISAVLYRRIYHPELLPSCRWSLGRWGVPVNICGILFSLHAFFWCSWPQNTPVSLESFNWAFVMFLGVLVISLVDYFLRGKKEYRGPVVFTVDYKGE